MSNRPSIYTLSSKGHIHTYIRRHFSEIYDYIIVVLPLTRKPRKPDQTQGGKKTALNLHVVYRKTNTSPGAIVHKALDGYHGEHNGNMYRTHLSTDLLHFDPYLLLPPPPPFILAGIMNIKAVHPSKNVIILPSMY